MKQTITLFESQLHSRSWQKLSVRILNVYLYLTLCVRSESNVTRHVVCGLSMCCYLTHRSKCMYTSQAVHLNKTKALGVNVSQLSLSQRTKGRRQQPASRKDGSGYTSLSRWKMATATVHSNTSGQDQSVCAAHQVQINASFQRWEIQLRSNFTTRKTKHEQ